MMWEEEFTRNRLAAQQVMGIPFSLADESAAENGYTDWAQTLENTRFSQRTDKRDKVLPETVHEDESKGTNFGSNENLWGEWRRLKDLSDALEYDTLRYSRFFEEQTE